MKTAQRKKAKLRKMWPLKVFRVTEVVVGLLADGMKPGDRITISGVRKPIKRYT